jgi:hypothetical protein
MWGAPPMTLRLAHAGGQRLQPREVREKKRKRHLGICECCSQNCSCPAWNMCGRNPTIPRAHRGYHEGAALVGAPAATKPRQPHRSPGTANLGASEVGSARFPLGPIQDSGSSEIYFEF